MRILFEHIIIVGGEIYSWLSSAAELDELVTVYGNEEWLFDTTYYVNCFTVVLF